MNTDQIRQNPYWAEFKRRVRIKLKEDIEKKGFDEATQKHFAAFCITFKSAISEHLQKADLSEDAKSELLADLFVWFFDEVMKDPE